MGNEIPSAVSDQTTRIHPEEALRRLALFECSRLPVFYESGIIDAGLGYYHLARINTPEEGEKRLLRFAFNLEEFQIQEYPGQGKLFAHPGSLHEVNAYDESASVEEIYADIVTHQTKISKEMREKYTLVRTGPGVYQSPPVSYAFQEGPPVKDAAKKLHGEIFINSLHHKKYAPALIKAGGAFYDRLQVSRIPLSAEGIDPQEAVSRMLGHFSKHLHKLAHGEDGIDGEDGKLPIRQRAALRGKMYGIRLLDRLTEWMRGKADELKKEPLGLMEFVERGEAVIDLLSPETSLLKMPIKFIGSMYDAFGFVPSKKGSEVPEQLRPYVNKRAQLPGQLGTFMYPTNASVTEMAVPMTMEEAGIAPRNAEIRPGSPFDAAPNYAPDFGALRAPLGTLLQTYPHTTLLAQANGVWMALHHASSRIYVGYNKNLDTDSKPYPPPILGSWLDEGKVIVYEHGNPKPVVMAWEKASADLQEIIASGDGHLLATHAPKHNPGPLVVPGHAPVNNALNLNFTEALRVHDEKMGIAEAADAVTQPAEKPAVEKKVIEMPAVEKPMTEKPVADIKPTAEAAHEIGAPHHLRKKNKPVHPMPSRQHMRMAPSSHDDGYRAA